VSPVVVPGDKGLRVASDNGKYEDSLVDIVIHKRNLPRMRLVLALFRALTATRRLLGGGGYSSWNNIRLDRGTNRCGNLV
jgi:hypothetical protein